ncbi:MAG: EAL domain-containing protein [Succinivibrio sp.]
MHYGTQLVALCVLLVVTIEFFQYRRIKILSTILFESFLFISIFCVVADAISLFAMTNPQNFSILANRIINQLYYATIAVMSFYIFIYIDIRGRQTKSYTLTELSLRTLPLLGAIVSILFGKINYHISVGAGYAYGSIVSGTYIISALYSILSIGSLLLSSKKNSIPIRYDVVFCFALWFAITVYQYFFQTSSLVSLAISMIVLFIFISYENSKENEDKDIHSLLSRNAFEMTIAELFSEKKPFYVICFSLQNTTSLRSTYSHTTFLDCIDKSVKSIPDFRYRNVFRISEFSFGFILMSKDELTEWVAKYKVSDKALSLEGSTIQPSYYVCAIGCPEIAADTGALFSLMSFCQSQFEAQNDHSIQVIDKDIVEKRLYILAVERLIQKAVDEDGFYIVYQPIIETQTGKCESAEALVRLKDTKSYGFISPDVFIPLAERCGLISKIGDQVFNKVCQFAKDYNLQDLGIKYIEVNLSGIQISDPSLPFRLHQTVKSYGLSPSFFNLEVTETALVKSGKIAIENMEKLKAFGYKFSMDDFGTGYSNYSQIANVRYDLIKMDKSLIWPAFEEGNEQAMTIMLACIKMLHTLGIKIVAEGVETKEQADLLKEQKVELLQGYYFSKPVKEQKFVEYIREVNQIGDSKESIEPAHLNL